MAFASRRTKGRPKPVMNVTPLVDVVLVLLIIFMVVLPAMDEQIQLVLPSIAQADEGEEEHDAYTLAIDASGAFFLDEAPVPPAALETTLRQAHRADRNKKLVLRGDRSLDYAVVRRLFASAQRIGFPGVLLRVNERADGSSAPGG